MSDTAIPATESKRTDFRAKYGTGKHAAPLNRPTVTPKTGGFHVDAVNAARRRGVAVPNALAEAMNDAFVERIVFELRSGNNVRITGLGVFKLCPRTAQDGKRVLRIKFTGSEELRSHITAIRP